MGKPVLSKQGLQKERENMRLYKRVLPSLELKRMQLTGELKRVQQELAAVQDEAKALGRRVAEQLPMLADRGVDLSGLVKVASIDMGEENVMGVRLPALKGVQFEEAPYSMLARPHWTDVLIEKIKEMVSQRILIKVTERRVLLLKRAAKKVTQRTNLFEKILIPEARNNIRKIQIYLADADRSAVIRSKITKRIRQKQAETFSGAVP